MEKNDTTSMLFFVLSSVWSSFTRYKLYTRITNTFIGEQTIKHQLFIHDFVSNLYDIVYWHISVHFNAQWLFAE